jgi:hypothetical protein
MKILVTVLGLVLAATAFMSSARADETASTDSPLLGHEMCYGEYQGTYSNGVRARFFLNGNYISIRLGDYVFSGHLRCESYGRGARVSYRVTNVMVPGEVYGRGRIIRTGFNMASIEVGQNNGLTFNGWSR